MRLVSTLLVLGLVGCMHGGGGRASGRWLPTATLLTPGTEVSAMDGSWTIAAEQPVPLPAQLANQPGPLCVGSAVPSAYSQWEQGGAIRVRVRVPGLDEPLYGIYALCPIASNGSGGAAGTYQVQIPQEYVDGTADGGISVVFQESEVPGMTNVYAWVLFLSRAPFPAPVGT